MIATRIRRIGNSLGVILPKQELNALNKGEGDLVYVQLSTTPTEAQLPSEEPDIEEVYASLSPQERDRFVLTIFDAYADSQLLEEWMRGRW